MTWGRWGHSAALVGGSFYIFGGINSMANLNDIYQFDISTCAIHVSPPHKAPWFCA